MITTAEDGELLNTLESLSDDPFPRAKKKLNHSYQREYALISRREYILYKQFGALCINILGIYLGGNCKNSFAIVGL